MGEVIALIITAVLLAPALRHPSLLKRAPMNAIPLEDGRYWDPNTGDIWTVIDHG